MNMGRAVPCPYNVSPSFIFKIKIIGVPREGPGFPLKLLTVRLLSECNTRLIYI